MPDLIVLRLHPTRPMSGPDFRDLLEGLSVTAHDLSFSDSVQGKPLGTAQNLADDHRDSPGDNSVDIKKTAILQHYRDISNSDPSPRTTTRCLEATATAVIVVDLPGHTDYPSPNSFDIRLELTRGDTKILDRVFGYNIQVTNVPDAPDPLSKPPWNDQEHYFGLTASAFVALPPLGIPTDEQSPTGSSLSIPTDGQPPNFEELVSAINSVLKKDPSEKKDSGDDRKTLRELPPLTADQSRQVAAEIVWNRTLFPLPPLPRTLGDLYTQPPVNPKIRGNEKEKAENDRKRFEGELQAYQATRDTEAARLAGFVFAASAAIACENSSTEATQAGLTFPIIAGDTAGTIPAATVILADNPEATNPLDPPFTVPAVYFYALGAQLPFQVSVQQRYEMARLESEQRLLDEFQAAIDARAIVIPAAPAVQPPQAARRLRALGTATPSLPVVDLAPPVSDLVTAWLKYEGPTTSIDTKFWKPKVKEQAYLALVLHAVTKGHEALIAAIQGPPHDVEKVADLVAITDRQWRDFFLGASPPPDDPPRLSLLPPFTRPGTPTERVEAFIRYLRKFFALPFETSAPELPKADAPPALSRPVADDDAANTRLEQAMRTYQLADVGTSDALQFSIAEALYARGFTSGREVAALTLDEFRDALTGTVAYEHAAAIYANAGGEGSSDRSGEGFRPVNPDGALTNCVPPPHRSPLGPVAYLHELLQVSAVSTCEDPLPDDVRNTLGRLIARRRGPVGNLHATRANLDTPLPLIDLANECMEAMAANLPATPAGVVYDTAVDVLAGHELRPVGSNPADSEAEVGHDPVVLLEALPEHSSPAVPVKQPAAYDRLERDFSSPLLPYSQPLDVCRSYLRQLGSSRYALMRRFRRDITELVLDPAHEPTEFQRHLWRYPVRIEIAREYLGITPEEYDLLFTQDIAQTLTTGRLLLRELYGFGSGRPDGDDDWVDDGRWLETVVRLSEFLPRAGLTYCEFIELRKSEFVRFRRAGEDPEFPDCEPCCLPEIRIGLEAPERALRHLAVFVRLWRKLQQVEGAKYSFVQLRDICDVLHLFQADGTVNPDFIRQLAAFQMLRDRFALALTDEADGNPGTNGADRMHLSALWVGPTARKWAWAVDALLDGIQHSALASYSCRCRPPEFLKLLADNLDPLSRLAGFDPDRSGDTWRAYPIHTLRFAEVLAKIYASEFGVGEIRFLFTVDAHLYGDDPFPLQPNNEALASPLGLPDDEDSHSLYALRKKLLAVEVTEDEVQGWTWTRIEMALREDFGYAPQTGEPDLLLSLGEHFFPTILETCGCQVDPLKRQYRIELDNTPAPMWNTPPEGAFRYDSGGKRLWTRLPLTDEAVIAKLSRIRQLNLDEQKAVQELYFLPRVDLAAFAFVFSDFGEAEERLIQEEDEHKRWAYFRREFAHCYARCRIIADHLAGHVAEIAGQERHEQEGLAWRLLRHLFADENRAETSWESDTGEVPEVIWGPQPNGGAFAALLGLTGTGLLGEFVPEDETNRLVWEDDKLLWERSVRIWREVRGPMVAFGPEENGANCPIPTILPARELTLTPDQQGYVTVRNGFALSNADGAMLGGAQGFAVRWQGALLVEGDGTYGFRAGAPTPEGEEPDFEAAEDRRWRVTLERGQKTWILLSHDWPDTQAPPACSAPVPLKRGAYRLRVELIQPHPPFSKREQACPQTTGFQLKYAGPDTGDRIVTLPRDKLFRDRKDETLAAGIDQISGAAKRFLETRFTSSLRDIRRSYQRAFKALLFTHRLDLSARPVADDSQSEIGYLLAHFDDFAGTAYFRDPPGASIFAVHKTHFDFNFLPLRDNYLPHASAQDQRVQPSAKRQQALFDWWERVFDYTALRGEAQAASERPVWLLFHEAAERHPDDPVHLLRHMGVDLRHASLALHYYLGYAVSSGDLEDERWAIRAWQAEQWLRGLLQAFLVEDIRKARPDLWASDDPNFIEVGETGSGNEGLTRFVRDGCFEHGEPRRYEDVKRLDDGLRERARQALSAYLCGMNRVALPGGGVATEPKHLSELLLLDVEAGLCQRAGRIEEAISAVQIFIQRARLGLETGFTPSSEFLLLWDSRFATYRVWEACKRREIYRESWIDWDELQDARQTESFRFLESELRRAALTVPVPGGLEYRPDRPSPIHPGLTPLQTRESARIQLLAPPREGLDLLGTPERHARPSWLAAFRGEDSPNSSERLPFWVQAAIRLGVKFVRVAAAGEPPAAAPFEPGRPGDEMGCCRECDKPLPPVIDEYYFWLMDSRYFDEATQDATWGTTTDNPESDWHRKDKLPGLLHWSAKPMVHLAWCRLHNGELRQPGRSFEGVRIADDTEPELRYSGRAGDSLSFEVDGGVAPPGHPAQSDPTTPGPTPPEPGFRYDLATDTAVVLPLVEPAAEKTTFPGGLPAYPYFAYFAPGAPLVPVSPFSPAVLVAGHLRAHCRFEAALEWYKLIFDPLQEDARWCRQEEVGCCQTDTVSDREAKDRSITLHYLETLLQWGDAVMRGRSPEAFQQARLIYDTAAKILGVRPQSVVEADSATGPQTVSGFTPLPAPLNPRLPALYETVEDRLALIHNCLDARRLRNGRPNQDMPYWGSRTAHVGWQPSLAPCGDNGIEDGLCLDDEDCCCPDSPYRFQFLVQKALELANDVRGFGAALLAAYEKGDAEYLASLRTTHERQLLNLALEIRQHQWRESDWQVQALRKTKEIAQTRKRYYETLIMNGLNSGETQYVALTGVSTGARAAANISEGIAQGMSIPPDMWIGVAGVMGTPLQFNQLPVGNKLASVFSTIARISNGLSEIAGTTGSLRLTQGGWERREDEWRHQVEVLGIEIEQIERQILAAERRRDIALRELDNHQRQLEHAGEVHDFLRDKFTNHALYLYLQQETAALHYQLYELALGTARHAQRAFNYERGHTARTFLPTEAWDNLHEGLLAGERLQVSMRQLERAYLCENVREYELTKHVSLRLHFPVEFLRLKVTGYCEIELPEWMFDLDYPGHYMRRLKNVTMTIPCVVGPYTGVHCRLTLLSSTTRTDPRLSDPAADCCDAVHKSGPAPFDECCRESAGMDGRQGGGYEAAPDDPRIVKQYAAAEAIATSSGQNDAGMFELNFRDERYLPFEFAGAVSRWRIELPPENNQFDMETLSDVIMRLSYTAREGGDVLRRAANAVAQKNLPGAGVRFFDVEQEFPEAWQRFRGSDGDDQSPKHLVLRLGRNMFPFFQCDRDLSVVRAELLFEAAGAVPSAHHTVEFVVNDGREYLSGKWDACEAIDIDCVAGADRPCLYHGVLNVPLGPVHGSTPLEIGTFRFPSNIGTVARVYLFLSYQVERAQSASGLSMT